MRLDLFDAGLPYQDKNSRKTGIETRKKPRMQNACEAFKLKGVDTFDAAFDAGSYLK